ncbi:MAG: hypothetical protein GY789_10305 [Hyphomicrobiales bacterium]|nr:hypothetical protein [Hyphomicrobiales bacterium]MCP5001817.1 hypothetical protein [Hyphomicrobiales bacterium]
MKDGNILMKVDYSYVFSEGWYGLIYGPTKSVEKTLATYKNQGARVRSRSDIDTKGGPFTRLTWHRGT